MQVHLFCARGLPVRADWLCTQVDSLRFSGVTAEMAARVFAIVHLNWQCFAGRNKLWAAWL